MPTVDEQAILDEGLSLEQFPAVERDLDYVANQYLPVVGLVLIYDSVSFSVTHTGNAVSTIKASLSATFSPITVAIAEAEVHADYAAPFDVAHEASAVAVIEISSDQNFAIAHVGRAFAVAPGFLSSASTFSVSHAAVANNSAYLWGNILNIPVWPFEANWDEDVRETLEWLTDVLTSPSGAEQRRSLRKYPRRTVEFSVVAKGRARALLDNLIMHHGGRDIYLPLWHEAHISSAVTLAGSDFIPCTTIVDGEISVGDIVMIGDGTPFNYELAEIEAMTAAGISTVGVLAKTWQPYSRIHPVRKARFTDQPEATRKTDDLATADVRFITSQANKDEIGSTSLLTDTYRGFGVLVSPPDEEDALTNGYDRMLEELDNSTGIPYMRDTAGIAFPKQKYAWTLRGRDEHKAFRNMLYTLRGRAVPIWLPTFYQDFILAESTPATNSFLIVENVGFTALGGAWANRQDICIELTDGTRLFRRITSSSVAADGNEIIAVDAPFVSGLDIDAVLRVSFMTLCRLDQDQVEIVHRTDSAGVALANTTFRAAPDLRQPLAGIEP